MHAGEENTSPQVQILQTTYQPGRAPQPVEPSKMSAIGEFLPIATQPVSALLAMSETQAAACSAKQRIKANKEVRQVAEQSNERSDEVHAFGYTFTLAPGFSIKINAESSLLLSSFAHEQGLAMCIESELQPKAGGWSQLLPTLSPDALRVFHEENAGGASAISECLSMEVLRRTFNASLKHTEMQLTYWPPNGAITDFSVVLDGVELGVSVTRAFDFATGALSSVNAEALLRKKLGGVLRSSATSCQDWRKQLLHIWCQSRADVVTLQHAYALLPIEIVADTVVIFTLCRGLHELFAEKQSKQPQRTANKTKGSKDAEHLRILAESDPFFRVQAPRALGG
uniref:Uncharacterized protein n=3 Tax=Chrysotila carterae TaxID=13221 RepID=A0A6S9SRW6_CHRCT